MLQGRTVIGDGSEIGPDTRLVDCIVGRRATVETSVVRDGEIGDGAHVGPFAFLPARRRRCLREIATGPFYTGVPD